MKGKAGAVIVLCTISTAFGQTAIDAGTRSLEIDQQRQRIATTRKERLAEFDAQDSACLARFAVTDCQNQVGARRRAVLADLKRQETRLNEADRQQKAAEQEQRSQDKASDRANRQSEELTTDENHSMLERQTALDEKVNRQQKQATTRTESQTLPRKSASTRDSIAIEKSLEAYSEKQRSLEQRRLERDKRLQESGNSSQPLPVPP